MSGDNRSVSTDALGTLGTIITSGGRDAIHLAVEPTVAKEMLKPGWDVGADGTTEKPWVGIVDPFLKKGVRPGEMFWLVLYPRTITSLRHVWSHPAFPDESEMKAHGERAASLLSGASEEWLRDFISQKGGVNYEQVLQQATGDHNGAVYIEGASESGDLPDEFWYHVEVVTGKQINKRTPWFSCAC